MTKPRKHIVIPDCQVRPGVPLDHMAWISNYISEKRPSSVICLGDFADLPSLSSYDIGKASAEGKRYADDVAVVHEAMTMLTKFRRGGRYQPRMVMTLGNHEARVSREAETNPRFKGTLSVDNLRYRDYGWEQHDFLKVVKVDGIEFSHFFVSGPMCRPVSSAAALLRQRHCSAVQGHVQRVDMAIHPTTQAVALFAGISYLHDEAYLTPQGNNTKRGIWMFNEVHGGTFDPLFVSLGFLKRRYS